MLKHKSQWWRIFGIVITMMLLLVVSLSAEAATTRKGGWLDQITFITDDGTDIAAKLLNEDFDVFTSAVTGDQMLDIKNSGVDYDQSNNLYYELTINPAGDPTFSGNGKFNPFSSKIIREAMNQLIDRDYLNEHIFNGFSQPLYTQFTPGWPEYLRHIGKVSELETLYAYDKTAAEQTIAAEMTSMGAVKVNGTWQYNGNDIALVILIRNDSTGMRIPIGDTIADQLESIGFVVDRQYKSSAEASPIWILSDPNDGLWNLYTGAWSSSEMLREEADDFQFFDSPDSAYGFTLLWQNYIIDANYRQLCNDLVNRNYTGLVERQSMIEEALETSLKYSFRVWLIQGQGFSAWNPDVSVVSTNHGGIDAGDWWPFTMRFEDAEGGQLAAASGGVLLDPINPIGGSNWTYDQQWISGITDNGTLEHPNNGLSLPQRVASAAVTVKNGIVVQTTYDWVTLDFADSIPVPTDAYTTWDATTQTFSTAGVTNPGGLTVNAKIVVTYPADLYTTVTWHDGSPLSYADFLMWIITNYDLVDASSAYFSATHINLLSSLTAFRITSKDPLVIEAYTDQTQLDAENMVEDFWPNYGYGEGAWHQVAVSHLGVAANAFNYYNEDDGQPWLNMVGGSTMTAMNTYLTTAAAGSFVPYAPMMAAELTAPEISARYTNLQNFYTSRGHFLIGTGPYILSSANYTEPKSVTLVQNPDFVDLSDKWTDYFALDLDTPVLRSPSDGAEIYGGRPTFKWDSVPFASYYKIQIKDSQETILGTFKIDQTYCTAVSCTYRLLTDLTTNYDTYTWKVLAVDSAGAILSEWSSARTFAYTQVTKTTLLSPENGSSTSDRTPTFSWQNVEGETYYQLQIRQTDDTLVLEELYPTGDICVDSICSVEITTTLADGDYKWHARGKNGLNYAAWTPYWYLTIGMEPLDTPILKTPADASIIYGGRPTLKWVPVTNALEYNIELRNPSNLLVGDWTVGGDCDDTRCSYRIPQDLESTYGVYQWRAQAKNGSAVSDWSAPFTFDYTQLARPLIISPEDGYVTSDTTPTLQWSDIEGATMYLVNFRLPDDTFVANMLVSDATYCDGSTCTWDVNPALALDEYKWHVRAKNGRNFGRWTAYRTITIE